MHPLVHLEYPEICYSEEISKVPKLPDNQGLTVVIFVPLWYITLISSTWKLCIYLRSLKRILLFVLDHGKFLKGDCVFQNGANTLLLFILGSKVSVGY